MVSPLKRAANRSTASRGTSCLAISLIIATLIMVFAPSGKPLDDNIRTGQAKEISSSLVQSSHDSGYGTDSENSNNNYSDKSDYESEKTEEVRGAVNNALADIKSAEEEELTKTKSTLYAAIATAGDFIGYGMKKLLGSDSGMTEDDIKQMVQQVEEKLTDQVNKELQEKADGILMQVEEKIEDATTAEEASGMATIDIEENVADQEEKAIHDLQSKIDATAAQLRKEMRAKAIEAEKQILEERLSIRLNKKVKLTILDDEIEGVEDLLTGLHVLKGGEPFEGVRAESVADSNTYNNNDSDVDNANTQNNANDSETVAAQVDSDSNDGF